MTFTGILGMLHRREADIALVNYYVDYNRKRYIDFTQPYGISHECFMVPIPRPYPKWTALYGPFQFSVARLDGNVFVVHVCRPHFAFSGQTTSPNLSSPPMRHSLLTVRHSTPYLQHNIPSLCDIDSPIYF